MYKGQIKKSIQTIKLSQGELSLLLSVILYFSIRRNLKHSVGKPRRAVPLGVVFVGFLITLVQLADLVFATRLW